jgi:hypothetical protein
LTNTKTFNANEREEKDMFPVPQKVCKNCQKWKSWECKDGITCLEDGERCHWQKLIEIEKKPTVVHGRAVHEKVGQNGRALGGGN